VAVSRRRTMMDKRTANALWLFAVLCGIAAFILITSFRQ
jgi:hypothetical protein